MSKNWLYVHEGKTRKVKKAYYVLGGKTHAIKKAYVVKDGLTHLFYAGVGMAINYTGEHTISDVTKDGVAYKLYTLTKSGTLTIDGDGTVQYWMCGGGGNGESPDVAPPGGGGGGGYIKTGTLTNGTMAVTIGAAGGSTKIGSDTASAGKAGGNGSGGNGASGGGAGGGYNGPKGGTGAGTSTYPFAMTNLYQHSAGGGGGSIAHSLDYKNNPAVGGKGGSNGSNGSNGNINSGSGNNYSPVAGGAGGSRGGGAGGIIYNGNPQNGSAATFYGSGGGGGSTGTNSEDTYASSGGKGYQGVCYLLVPADLLAA